MARDSVESPPARIFLQPLAAPSILGLFGFAAATGLVASHLAGWWGDANTPFYLAPFAGLVGGVAQLCAGLWAYRARDGLATAMHGIWGAFWLAYAVLYLAIAAGVLPQPPAGPAFPALGLWFVALAAVTWFGALAALGESFALLGVLTTLATGASLLAAGLIAGSGYLVGVAGWLLVISALLAWYTAGALMLEGVFGRPVLPLGRFSKTRHAPAVAAAAGEPGAQHGRQ